MKKLNVVISYYKALDNLKLVLKALNNQSCMDFEVTLSEDDNNSETVDFIKNEAANYAFPIHHIYQTTDNGFKKNQMLNRAIMHTNIQKIAFIDGDCVPHKHFVKQYILNITDKTICVGRSVMLDEETTATLRKTQSLKELSFLPLLFSKAKKIKEGIYFPYFPLQYKLRGLVGRNWGCPKSALVAINGFDQDYFFAGIGEDVDIEWRLLKFGLTEKSVKNKAIVFHLHHKRWYSSENERINFKMMEQKIELNQVRCLNGIESN
jgi:GT2 family glycosyltransferase